MGFHCDRCGKRLGSSKEWPGHLRRAHSEIAPLKSDSIRSDLRERKKPWSMRENAIASKSHGTERHSQTASRSKSEHVRRSQEPKHEFVREHESVRAVFIREIPRTKPEPQRVPIERQLAARAGAHFWWQRKEQQDQLLGHYTETWLERNIGERKEVQQQQARNGERGIVKYREAGEAGIVMEVVGILLKELHSKLAWPWGRE